MIVQKSLSKETMYFHAGQEYAMEGDRYYENAINSFTKSFKDNQLEWNLYVKGTIAFLKRDRENLLEVLEELSKLTNEHNPHYPNFVLLQNFVKGLEQENYSYRDIYGV